MGLGIPINCQYCTLLVAMSLRLKCESAG